MSVQVGSVSGRRARRLRADGLRPQFRLRPGQDDVLIEWLTSLSPRRRSQAIREALLQYVASRQDGGRGGRAEDPDLAAALDSLF